MEIEATGLEKVTPAMPIPRATVSSPELTLLPSVTMASASASDAARMRKSSERASKRLLVVDTETMMTRCGSMPSCAAISTANCCLTLSVMSFTVSGPPIVIDISTAGPGTTMNSLEVSAPGLFPASHASARNVAVVVRTTNETSARLVWMRALALHEGAEPPCSNTAKGHDSPETETDT